MASIPRPHLDYVTAIEVDFSRALDESDVAITPPKEERRRIFMNMEASVLHKESQSTKHVYAITKMSATVRYEGDHSNEIAKCKVTLQGFFKYPEHTSEESIKSALDVSGEDEHYQEMFDSLFPLVMERIKRQFLDANISIRSLPLSLSSYQESEKTNSNENPNNK